VEETLMHLLEVDGVLGALLLSEDGLPVASANLETDESETVGALATAMLAGLRGNTDRLGVGEIDALSIATSEGQIDLHVIRNLVLLLFREERVDEPTLATVLDEVTEECVAFAV
jgi:predicted regulator of Ras-like GTPase activity (Roadblock/LC7/MglB family)